MSFFKEKGLLSLLLLSLFFGVPSMNAQEIKYPHPKKVEQKDNLFGVTVEDPYRWMEDDNSPERAKWVQAENEISDGYFNKIEYRQKIKDRIAKVLNYPRYSSPFRESNLVFFFKNDGLQNQSVMYVQNGLEGKPEVLLDPNTFSADGTTTLSNLEISKDAKYIAYGTSVGGSDWQDGHIMEIATRKVLPETLKWIKFSGFSWYKDGFYYSRYDEPEKGKELSSKNEHQQVFYHKLGTPQSEDKLIYEDKEHLSWFNGVDLTEDERFLLLYVNDPLKNGNALYYRDLSKGDKEFKPIISTITDDATSVIDNIGDKFLLFTNVKAPNNRVVLCDPSAPQEQNWKDVLPEQKNNLVTATTAGGKLFATYSKDITSRVYVHSLDGKLENEIKLPSLGFAGGFGGHKEDKYLFYTFSSFNVPPTIYRYDVATQESKVFRKAEVDFKSEDYELKQVFYPSKDGTKIPMFLFHKKGIKLDGNNPVLLYGYGGFNIPLQPYFSSLLLPLVEQGVIYAVANLRGGSEYGEAWHKAGARSNKQNVFDDFISAAEYLIKEKYTSSDKLAVKGESNGGLLIGTVINQRPDLFKAALPGVGVMDMLRFHKFTIGEAWTAEYGSPDNEADFKTIYRYSPLHNIRAGAKYPAILVNTADHDDRVVPMHSLKYIATMQEKNPANTVLIRVDTKSGHGVSNTTKLIDETGDNYAFIFHTLGVHPNF